MRKRKALVCFTIVASLVWTLAACAVVTSLPLPTGADPSVAATAHPGPSEEAGPPRPEPAPAQEVLQAYVSSLSAGDYEAMYGMIHTSSGMSKEDFITRNRSIYEGVKAESVSIRITEEKEGLVSFQMTMDTVAGRIVFANQARFGLYDGAYKLEWSSAMIFPTLGETDKVRVATLKAERGSILDRNGRLLVGKDRVYSIGFVPGKIDPLTRQEDIAKVAEILGITVKEINARLSENWVRDNLFVPIKNISFADTGTLDELLEIKGIDYATVKDRVYKLGEKAAHLTGYVASISKEQLDALPDQGYDANSKIGKVGLESLWEERLRGVNGSKITIVDKDNKEKQTLAERLAQNGEDITLTIDSGLQTDLYNRMKKDKGVAVVMDPKSGEILALVSTPSYDPNDFILGMSDEKWAQYNDEQTRPMFNRFKAAFAPGSSIKPITAAIGLSAGAFEDDEDFGSSGLSWQKSSGWGSYKVTTLQQYDGAANTLNALVYSDNIYFAKAALKTGADEFADGLKAVGFGEEVPFAFGLSKSSFGTSMAFTGEIDLADSGYGQGKVLINPVHMAAIYTAFANQGTMMAPRLEKKAEAKVWKENVFPDEVIRTVRDAMVQVVENPKGTGHSAQVDGIRLAGKTGTAEIKTSKQDTGGTELGWFVAYPAQDGQDVPYLALAMVEDVKGRGGSHYVIPIVRSVFAADQP